MSQRSIIELNHDAFNLVDSAQVVQFERLLSHAVASGSDRAWEPLKAYGIRRIVQVHHSADRKVIVDGKEHPIT